MSFPNIPDIDPCINLSFDDAINLLLTSIAMEEVSLSKLIDAETEKIKCVLDDCKHKDSALVNALEVNKSVDKTIKNIIKLQMLLQFKLENVSEILPTSSTTSTTTTTTTTTTTSTTTSHTTTCSISTFSTTTCCCLTGNAEGCVSNCCDEFNGYRAELHAFVLCCDINSRTIRYTVKNNDVSLNMYAYGNNVGIQCSGYPNEILIYGKGYVKKYTQCDCLISGPANFILTVRRRVCHIIEFKMELDSDSNPELNHDSGFVNTKSKARCKQPETCSH